MRTTAILVIVLMTTAFAIVVTGRIIELVAGWSLQWREGATAACVEGDEILWSTTSENRRAARGFYAAQARSCAALLLRSDQYTIAGNQVRRAVAGATKGRLRVVERK